MTNQQVLFEPSQTQKAFLKAIFKGDQKYILFGGSIGGGKTYASLGALLMLSLKYPGSRWIVVRNTLASLKQTTIPSFFKLCPTDFITTYNQDTQTVTFSNNSQIIFWGENYDDDKELLRWRGLEASGFVFEEANELQEASFYKAIERAGRWIPPTGEKPLPLILLTCNPSRNWIKTMFYDRWESGSLPADWAYIPSKITDNPFVANDVAYMESLKNMPTYQYEVFVNGNWNLQEKVKDAAYKCFDPDVHAANQYEYDPNKVLFLSFDENVSPFLTCIAFQIHIMTDDQQKENIEIRIIEEILAKDPVNTVSGICSMIMKRFPPGRHKSTVEIYGDSTSQKQDTKLEKGANFFSLIRGELKGYIANLRVLPGNENVSARLNWIDAILEKENSRLRLRIDKRCKNTVSDFMMTKKAADGNKLKELTTDPSSKVRYQKNGHITDAVDYFLTGHFNSQYQYYKNSGVRFGVTTGKNARSKNSF